MISIDEDSGVTGSGIPAGSERPVLNRITLATGLITGVIGILGLIGLTSGITVFTSVLPGYKPIAVSAALIWIFLGLALAFQATRAHIRKLVLAVQVVLAGVVIIEVVELLFSLMGSHSIIEILSVRIGSTLLGTPTTPISPAASALIISAAIALFLLLSSPGINSKRNQRLRDAAGITGLAIALTAFTFVLSYVYGAPFLYNTMLIPMALTSAIAGFFAGVGIVAAAGRTAIPLKYFAGSSTQARLLRVFVPLVIILTVVQDIIFIIIADIVRVQDALFLSVCIVLFSFVTAWVIARFSGRIGRELERAEDALRQKNEDLGAMNEELTTIAEELRQNNDELLRKEKALRESQQRNTFLADILNRAAQPFAVGYPDGKMGIVNKAFEDLTGYSSDELKSIDWKKILTPPEWNDVERRHLDDLHRTGKPVVYEKEYIRKDGTRVPIELLVHLVKNEDGSPRYYYSFLTDITARKQAEQKIESLLSEVRTERDRLSALINSISDEIWFADTEKRFTLTNPSALREFAREYGDTIGVEEMAAGLEVFRPDGSPRPLEEAPPLRALAGEVVKNQEEMVRTPVHGDVRYRQVTSTPVRDAQGIIIGSVSVVRDITDSRKAQEEILNKNEELNAVNEELISTQEELLQKIEEITKAGVALREAQMRTKTVLEGIADTFYSLDDTWRFTVVNPAAEKAPFGRPAAELLGRVIWELYPALVGTRIHQHYVDAAEKHSLEHYVAQSPLNKRWYEVFMQGRKGGLDVYMRDITDRKVAEDALRENEQRLNLSLEVSRMGTWDLDLVRHTAYRSLRHDQIFGYEELLPEWTYEMFLAHVIPEDREDVDRKFQAAIEQKEDWNFECRILRRDGFVRWIHARGRGEYDTGGKPIRMIGIVQDITKRKHAEEAMRNTSQYLENLIDYANAPIIVWDPGFRITRFNHAFERLTGRKASEVIGQPLELLFPEKYTATAMDIIRKTTSGERLEVVEIPILQVQGNVRTVLWNSATIFGPDGKTILATIAQGNDITERKRAEGVLQSTLQRLNTLISSMHVGILLVWGSRIEYTNQTFCDYFELREPPAALIGLTQQQLIEKIRNVYLHPDEEAERINEIVRLRQPVTGEEVAMQSGRTYLRDFIPIVVEGTMLGRLWYHLDITERKKAEEELLRRNEDLNAAYEQITATQEELQQSNNELLESEHELRKTSQYLENLIDYANAPIVVWDPNFVITRFNHAFEELTGRTAREIIGQRLEVLFPPRYLDASMEIIRKTISGERLKVVEIPILNRRGEIRIVLWNSATLFEADGRTILSTIAQGNDITERKVTEAELEERNEELNSAIEELTRRGIELNEALREKEVLLSEVHHRVKNNLTAFISLLSLESSYDDSPAGLALKKDLQNRARSMALIHETLYRTKKYSRVDMGEYLSTLVEQIVNSYESAKPIMTLVETYGITLDLSRATPCGLIVNELLTNSLKYAFPASFDCATQRGTPCMIEVSLEEDDGSFILTVRDNGVGLPGDLDISTTKTLGLKLVRFLAKHQMKSSVEAHSHEGTEFRFRFRDKV